MSSIDARINDAQWLRHAVVSMSHERIAVELGCSRQLVGKRLAGFGITGPTLSDRGRKRTNPNSKLANHLNDIVQKYDDGWDTYQIADMYGVTPGSVAYRLKRAGVRLRSKGTKSLPVSKEREIVEKYLAGATRLSLQQEYGYCYEKLAKILQAHDADIPHTGEKHWSYKGPRVNTSGYRQLNIPKNHPFACMRSKKGYVLEHRLVMAEQLGRPLFPWEEVHHKDGVKLNNDPNNLQLRMVGHGSGQVARCACCGSTNIVFDPLPDPP